MAQFDIRKFAAVGLVLEVDEQRFHLIVLTPHTRADGTPTFVARWEADCALCGEGFEVETGLYGRTPTRRCEPCRKVPKSGMKRRGRSTTITVIVP